MSFGNCKDTGKYKHDPSGDKALPYKHDKSGDTAIPYKHDSTGDNGPPYKHDPSGDTSLWYKHDSIGNKGQLFKHIPSLNCEPTLNQSIKIFWLTHTYFFRRYCTSLCERL